jgi:SNF2 family DNA or RNA helicase
MKTYGTAKLDSGGTWHIDAEPHIVLRLKRIFERVDKNEHGGVTLKNSPEVARDLEWFCSRYPLSFEPRSRVAMGADARKHREHIRTMEDLLGPGYVPKVYPMARPPRHYQVQAAEAYLRQGHLLLADDVGVGKTCSSICSFTDPRCLPALVVCYPFLQKQWEREVAKFMPGLRCHILAKGTPYPLPLDAKGRTPDVIITTYYKLSGWAEVLRRYVKSAVLDECQEFRYSNTQKYGAIKHILRGGDKRVYLLSATPVVNYGGEMFNVLDLMKPGCLGTHEEFTREWCTSQGNGKWRINDPRAFGSYLRENFLMLRRTREEVGRELPPVQKTTIEIESDQRALAEVEGASAELARIILTRGTREQNIERLQASAQLSNVLRQATGISKAGYVSEFVKMLVESGERVILAGWHRAVYELWHEKLKQAGLRVEYFTGSETPQQKERVRELFIRGEVDVMFLSLRSGAGVDGWQSVCKVVVFGELDWSPTVMDQLIGRVHRDGQDNTVTVYYLVSDDGTDPLMAEVLGLKRAQSEGIRNPKGSFVEAIDAGGIPAKRLAEDFLRRNGLAIPVQNVAAEKPKPAVGQTAAVPVLQVAKVAVPPVRVIRFPIQKGTPCPPKLLRVG